MASQLPWPRKTDQDRVDACLCLLVAIHQVDGGEGLFVGDPNTGYIVVSQSSHLMRELSTWCVATERDPRTWVRSFHLSMPHGCEWRAGHYP